MTNEKTSFTVRLAGVQLELRVDYSVNRQVCEAFLSEPDEAGALTVSVTEQDALYEARRENPALERFKPGEGAYYESLAMFRRIAETLITRDTLLIHGSAIAVDGEAYLFSAPSGTGKSTHTALWREHFGPRAMMVNDDKPLIRIEEGRVMACGSPWNGKHRLGKNVMVPLRAICYLERAAENSITRLSQGQALAYVLRQTYRPRDPELMAQTMKLLSRLLLQVPVYRMQVNNFCEDAVSVAYEGMKKQ